ncbi:diacylglycerol kinase family protein [Caulobacter sp. S45]|uniref:diacylglycerol/lipid kinase family protein n=1 Tax=Caulobacter sp. S45 TaxID=1641861 RepID=UPI001575AEBC|nr:diacylglycerol kinase family protein [Caulobacter sp. S45]
MAELHPDARLTPHVRLGKVTAVLNAASGSVGADAAARMKAIAARYGLDIEPRAVQPAGIADAVRAAVAERPDALFVLAGDGTLALSAELCGPDGPLLAALPGGTMNMLPHALNGRRAWPEALTAILETGRELEVSGGEVGGHGFYVAAILGAPALWADAREAVRKGKLKLAVLRARRALLRAFKGRLRFELNGGERRKAEALTLMCPLVSQGLDEDVGLEAATLDPKGALDGFRLGFSTLTGGWRNDPSVKIEICTSGTAWAHGRVPVILDGEPRRMDPPVKLAYRRRAFRALVPGDCEALRARSEVGEHAARKAARGAAAVGVERPAA